MGGKKKKQKGCLEATEIYFSKNELNKPAAYM